MNSRFALPGGATLKPPNGGRSFCSATRSDLRNTGNVASASRDASMIGHDAAAAVARLRKIAESDEFQKILVELDRTVTRVDRLVAGRENDIAVTVNNLRQITDNLRELSENAKRYPSGVIFGEPPKRESRGR